MTETDKSAHPKSLGDLFYGLRTGAPCPWCGEELRSRLESSLGMVDEEETSEYQDESVLWCPGCGAEVYECLSRADARNGRRLGAAA